MSQLPNVLSGLNHLRKLNSYCDIELKVGDKVFPAHKNVLAAFSPYFAKRIVSNGEADLELNFLSADIFEVVMDYGYTSSIIINATNAEQLLYASCHLEVAHLAHLCQEYLGKRISAENFLNMYQIASKLSCSELADSVNKFILKNFNNVYQLEAFLKLSPEMLIEAIKSDDLVVQSEDVVLNAVMRWINYDVAREDVLPKVFQYIRLNFVSVEALNHCVKEEVALRSSADCVFWCSQVFMAKLKPNCESYLLPTFVTPRRVTCGDVGMCPTCEITQASLGGTCNHETPGSVPNPAENRVETVEPINSVPGELSDADLVKQVLLCRGTIIRGNNESSIEEEEYFFLNVKDGRKRLLKPLPYGSNRIISSAVVGNKMYALVEGLFEDDDGPHEKFIHQYDLRSEEWKNILRLTRKDENGDFIRGIFVLGSSYLLLRRTLSGSRDFQYLERYHIGKDTAPVRLKKNPKFCCHCLILSVNSTLYVFSTTICKHFEVVMFYDARTDDWTAQPPPSAGCPPRSLCCEFEGKVYIVQISDAVPTEKRSQVTFQVYDVASGDWMSQTLSTNVKNFSIKAFMFLNGQPALITQEPPFRCSSTFKYLWKGKKWFFQRVVGDGSLDRYERLDVISEESR